MALADWHNGKLVILWAWAAVIVGLSLTSLDVFGGEYSLLDLMYLLLISGVPIGMSIVTWRWLGGKEKGDGRKDP